MVEKHLIETSKDCKVYFKNLFFFQQQQREEEVAKQRRRRKRALLFRQCLPSTG